MAGTAVLGRLTWQLAERRRRRRRDAARQDDRLRRARLARPPRRPARRRPADGRGRLPGAAQLLDRVGARRHARRAHRRAARRRRGLALPDRRAAAGRPDRAARPDRRLLRLGAVTRAARCCSSAGGSGIVPLMAMIRTRAPPPAATPRRGCSTPRAAGTTSSIATSSSGSSGNGLTVVHTLTRSQPPGWTGYARRIDAEMLAEVGPRPAERPRCLRLRPDAVRRGRGRGARAARARAATRSRPSASDRREAEMDELMLDGNAVAGLLQEVFAVEMTTAIGTCGRLRRDRAGRGRPRLPRRRHRPPLPALRQRPREDRQRRHARVDRLPRSPHAASPWSGLATSRHEQLAPRGRRRERLVARLWSRPPRSRWCGGPGLFWSTLGCREELAVLGKSCPKPLPRPTPTLAKTSIHHALIEVHARSRGSTCRPWRARRSAPPAE